MQKAVREIDEADQAGKLSDPIQDAEVRNELPYINAVIKEAMRLHPSVGLILYRHVPAGGATICGKHISEGTTVGINAWVVHQDPDIFPNPTAFEPERWLETGDNEAQLAGMEKAFFPFGAGSRSCIGKQLSMMEMRKIVPQLLRAFDISIPGDEEWKIQNFWFVFQDMPPCLLQRRNRA